MSNHILKGTVTVSVSEYKGYKEIVYRDDDEEWLAKVAVMPVGSSPRVAVSWAKGNDVWEPDATQMSRLLAVVARRARKEEEKLK